MTAIIPPDRSAYIRHAWDWFDLHSKQRMQTVNFYIVIVAGLLAATAASVKEANYPMGVVMGLLVSVSSLLFFAMDRRARILVRLSEAALRCEEAYLVSASGNEALNLVERSAQSGERSWTYGRIFIFMFSFFAAVGLAIAGFCLERSL